MADYQTYWGVSNYPVESRVIDLESSIEPSPRIDFRSKHDSPPMFPHLNLSDNVKSIVQPLDLTFDDLEH